MSDGPPDNLPVPAEPSAVDSEIATLREEMRGGPDSPYWRDPRKQDRYRALQESKVAPHPAPAQSNTVPATAPPQDSRLVEVEGFDTPSVLDAMTIIGGGEDVAVEAINRAQTMLWMVPVGDREAFNTLAGAFSDDGRFAIVRELAAPAPENANHASSTVLDRLVALGAGPLLRDFGIGAPRRIGLAEARVNRLLDAMPTEEDAKQLQTAINGMSGGELMAVLRTLAR